MLKLKAQGAAEKILDAVIPSEARNLSSI